MEASRSSPPLPDYLLPVDESKLSPRVLDLVRSLPSEPSWLSGSFHQYQGYWFPTICLETLLEFQDHHVVRDSDIFLITLPKSGTTWLKAILFAVVNRTRYHPSSPDHPLLSKNPHDLVVFMEPLFNPHSEKKIPDFDSSTPQRIFSTHVPYVLLPESVKESSCKIIYLCRNPKDVLASRWCFMNKLRGKWCDPLTLDDAFDMFCRGMFLGGPYWENVLGHWKDSLANPHKVMFLKYEELKQSPGVLIRKLAGFIGCPFSTDEESKGIVDDIIKLCSFNKLSSLDVNGPTKKVSMSDMESSSFFRRGTIGDWVNYLTPQIAARLDRITEEKFRGSGLSF